MKAITCAEFAAQDTNPSDHLPKDLSDDLHPLLVIESGAVVLIFGIGLGVGWRAFS